MTDSTASIDLRYVLSVPDLAVSLQLPANKIIVITGPSGSGKSTLLRLVAGLVKTPHGHLSGPDFCWQNDHQFIPAHRRRLGYVSQSFALFPHCTVAKNIAMALSHLDRHARHQEVTRLLAMVGLSGLDTRMPHTLSGGQKQRVALARALARKPHMLLLDEPFAAIDKAVRKRLYVEIKKLHNSYPMTILLATHDLDEAALLADHTVLVHRGRIVEDGPTQTVLTRPRRRQSAQLIEMINIFTIDRVSPTTEACYVASGPLRLQCLPSSLDDPKKYSAWGIAPRRVRLIKPHKPLERTWPTSNIIDVTIVDMVHLADRVQMHLAINIWPEKHLVVFCHLAVVERLALYRDQAIKVFLPPDDLVLMRD